MPYVFLLPNLALLRRSSCSCRSASTSCYSVTGGPRCFPPQRPLSGAGQYAYLFDCGTYRRSRLLPRGPLLARRLQHRAFAVSRSRDGAVVAAHRPRAQHEDPRPRLLPRRFLLPGLLSPVVVALIWKWILQRDGLLNARSPALGGDKILFFVDPGWALFWAVFVSIWAHMGFYTLILLAGLQAIPADLYEAAEMDATPRWRVFWRITLPLLWPNLIVVIVLALIRAVQTFDEVFVLTGGGPGHRDADGRAVHLRDASRTRSRISASPPPPPSCSASCCSR